jgi:multidrug transporter EmrE-like cation transporter
MDNGIYFGIAVLSVLIADVSQIILKKAATKDYESWYKSYLNFSVIFAYSLFVLSTICSVVALKKLPLSLSPMWQSMGQVFIVVLSYLFLHEKPGKKKLLGIAIIVLGIVIFSIR